MFDTLRAMLTYCRPHGSYQDRDFCKRFIAPLPGAYQDTIGNWHVTVSEDPILWSCHTDTVHRLSVRQRVILTDDWIHLPPKSKSNCLGADDTAGVWLMTELIAARVPGHYIFHAGEERGCIGSRALARNHADWLKRFHMAIALDRRGESDVITHQSFGRCCSDPFAEALADKLGHGWTKSDGGIYTDTAEYMDLIPECTNLSVGYYGEHGPNERLNLAHLARMLSALLSMNYDDLPIVRDPAVWEDDRYFDWPPACRWKEPASTGRITDRAVMDDDMIVRCLDCLRRDIYSSTDGEHCMYCGGPIDVELDDDDRLIGAPNLYLTEEYAEVAKALAKMGGGSD